MRRIFGAIKSNAYKYWFINTYRKWAKIDGKMAEVWHEDMFENTWPRIVWKGFKFLGLLSL